MYLFLSFTVAYHLLVHAFLHQGDGQSGNDSSLDVQDGGGLAVLRVELHVILALDHKLQRIPGRKYHNIIMRDINSTNTKKKKKKRSASQLNCSV